MPARVRDGVFVAATLAGCLASPAQAGGKAAAPYDVAVQVQYGAKAGSESVRDWAEREIVREIDEAGCFLSVTGFAPDGAGQPDLLVRVIVQDFEEKTEYETSLAQREDPYADPTTRLRLVASLEIWGDLQLLTLPERRAVRARNLHLTRGYRPMVEEDPGYEVRRLLIAGLAADVRGWACKGARKKLPGEIERALTGDTSR